MKCAQCQSIIDDIGDMDRLPVDAARHVASCAACEKFGVELIVLRSLLREPARVSTPETFDFVLARRLREAKAHPPSRIGALWALRPQASIAAAAAFLFVCSGALVVSRYSTSPEADPGSGVFVATNRAVPVESPAAAGPQFDPPRETPEIAATKAPAFTSAADMDSRPARGAGRLRTASRTVAPAESMLLVSDDNGTRLVDVPNVLVGSELIVPVSMGDGVDSSQAVAF